MPKKQTMTLNEVKHAIDSMILAGVDGEAEFAKVTTNWSRGLLEFITETPDGRLFTNNHNTVGRRTPSG